MSTSEKLAVTRDIDNTIEFGNQVESSNDPIERLLLAFGHLVTPESWAHSQSNQGRIIWCSHVPCHKIFTFQLKTNAHGTVRGGPKLAPTVSGYWELRRLEVRNNDEHLYSRGGLTIITERQYKIADLKRQLPKHFLCNRYLNLL